MALAFPKHSPGTSRRRALLICLGVFGAALLYGDGMITPAISVLSAIEGLKLDAPQLALMVVPLSVAILFCLFLVQRKGTTFIGNIFGPVMLLWFVAIGVLVFAASSAHLASWARSARITRSSFTVTVTLALTFEDCEREIAAVISSDAGRNTGCRKRASRTIPKMAHLSICN